MELNCADEGLTSFDLEKQLDLEIKVRAAREEGNEELAEELIQEYLVSVIKQRAPPQNDDSSFPPPGMLMVQYYIPLCE